MSKKSPDVETPRLFGIMILIRIFNIFLSYRVIDNKTNYTYFLLTRTSILLFCALHSLVSFALQIGN